MMMESRKTKNSELIAKYKSEASARRAVSVLNTNSESNSSHFPQDSDTQTVQRTASKVRVTNRAGVITIDTSGAKPIPRSADKTKIFGRSNISIPEYRLYRK
jgi:hypothetical protein